ncbi:MAG: leishmanolysin-related zinc metalloendopeptidase [Aureliella sp.]
MKRFFSAFLVVLAVAVPSHAGLTINYTGPAQYQAAFNSAETTWESILIGYQGGVAVSSSQGSSVSPGGTLTNVIIDATVEDIDGVGGTLGSAGPTAVISDNLGFTLATDGRMRFDEDDVANLSSSGTLEAVILHEMAHVLGFGTLWVANNVYSNGSGEYTGAAATLQWQTEFGQTGTPDVELQGGTGTADGHWNENFGGNGLVGITDSMGRDMRDEIMTGWLNPNPFISRMTIESFSDIGFEVAAVPEPNSLLLLAAGTFGLMRRRRKS